MEFYFCCCCIIAFAKFEVVALEVLGIIYSYANSHPNNRIWFYFFFNFVSEFPHVTVPRKRVAIVNDIVRLISNNKINKLIDRALACGTIIFILFIIFRLFYKSPKVRCFRFNQTRRQISFTFLYNLCMFHDNHYLLYNNLYDCGEQNSFPNMWDALSIKHSCFFQLLYTCEPCLILSWFPGRFLTSNFCWNFPRIL